jgi:hypothetical protein
MKIADGVADGFPVLPLTVLPLTVQWSMVEEAEGLLLDSSEIADPVGAEFPVKVQFAIATDPPDPATASAPPLEKLDPEAVLLTKVQPSRTSAADPL